MVGCGIAPPGGCVMPPGLILAWLVGCGGVALAGCRGGALAGCGGVALAGCRDGALAGCGGVALPGCRGGALAGCGVFTFPSACCGVAFLWGGGTPPVRGPGGGEVVGVTTCSAPGPPGACGAPGAWVSPVAGADDAVSI